MASSGGESSAQAHDGPPSSLEMFPVSASGDGKLHGSNLIMLGVLSRFAGYGNWPCYLRMDVIAMTPFAAPVNKSSLFKVGDEFCYLGCDSSGK
jgi:hypothetical protein